MRRFWLLLLLAPLNSVACDWTVSKKNDHMTDKPMCMIASKTAKIGLSVSADRVIFVTTSAYSNGREFLQIRVDENPIVSLGERGMASNSFDDDARVALRQILSGSRLRTSYRDYPSSQEGEAMICNLPDLLQECGAPIDRIKDTRSQADIIKGLNRKRP